MLAGAWSRRITEEHRLVYLVDGDDLVILQPRFHYEYVALALHAWSPDVCGHLIVTAIETPPTVDKKVARS